MNELLAWCTFHWSTTQSHHIFWLKAPEWIKFVLAIIPYWRVTAPTGEPRVRSHLRFAPSSYLIDELQLQPLNLGLEPTYDLLWHYHCLSAVHDYQLSAIELFQPPLLVPGTMCRLMSHPHQVCQFSVAAWRPTSSSVHSLDCCSRCELAKVIIAPL